MSYEGLPGSGIELISRIKPEFRAALEQQIDAKAIEALGPILPYSVLVENQTSRNLMQISVRAFLTDTGGKTIESVVVFGRSGYPVRWVAGPGETILVTPPYGILTTVLQKGMTIPEAAELKERLSKRAANLSKVRIILDSVVFDDGEVIGPDRLGALIRINALNAADANVAAMSADQLASILEPEELQTRSSGPSRENMSEEQLWTVLYDEKRSRFAQGLLRLEPERLLPFMQNVLAHPYPTAWRKP